MMLSSWTLFAFMLVFIKGRTEGNPQSTECPLNGLEYLKNTHKIKAIRANFAFKQNRAYYLIRFCGRKTKPLCFVTSIFDEPKNYRNSKRSTSNIKVDVVGNVALWTKLISTIIGKNQNIVPLQPSFGNEHEQARCQGKYYFITKTPSKETVKEILEEGKRQGKLSCKGIMKDYSCQRTCLKAAGEECDIRLHCTFKVCPKHNLKKVDLQELRRNAKKDANRKST